MLRWIALLSTLLLSACVTTREVVYRDGYYPTSSERYYSDQRSDGPYVSRDGSYYAPAYGGSGDYYYRDDLYAPAYYLDYPAYYSLFWSLNRSWYDPYWYPGYYYGVTYFPRNYLSIGLHSGYAWPRYSYWAYSPYRYSWADNYYDWSPWHGYYGRHRSHHSAPRYGSARNEAERLARIGDVRRAHSRGDFSIGARGRGVSDNVRRTPYGTYGTARGNTRDADYGSRSSPRQDPGTRGFGVPVDQVRRTGPRDAYQREMPATRGFGVPSGEGSNRGSTSGDVRRRGDVDSAAARELGRTVSGPQRGYAYPRSSAVERDTVTSPAVQQGSARRESTRGYDAGGVGMPRSSYQRGGERAQPSYERAPIAREYSRPQSTERASPQGSRYAAPQHERSYAPVTSSAPSRGYDAGRAAPAPVYSAPAPAAPRYESRPESSREVRTDSARESSRSDSGRRSSSSSEVRRVGSRRRDD